MREVCAPFSQPYKAKDAALWRRLVRAGLLAAAVVAWLMGAAGALRAQTEPPPPALQAPVSVYNNWSSYDELSDRVSLNEQLAMRELDELLRLKRTGVRFDYYVMDAFWYAPDGAYRTWRKPDWPNGPDAWLKKCRENGIKPGLWFPTNMLFKLEAAPEWRSSLNKDAWAMSLFEGGYLQGFMDVLQFWYDRGVRMYKFDFANFEAATPASEATLSKTEIKERNSAAFREALRKFRTKNPEAVFLGFNGFGGSYDDTFSPLPFANPADLRWLDALQSMYTGDPRAGDVPEANFWRAMDIYGDHSVRRFEQVGFPLERLDPTSFMAGLTGTSYNRGAHAWKGAFLLMMARGGWVNSVYGNLELIQGDDAAWMARVQKLFLEIQGRGRIRSFGGIPGDVQPYGFAGVTTRGAVYVVMNPSQTIATLNLPKFTADQPEVVGGRVQFRDAGFQPRLTGNTIVLGPGQMAMAGFGAYAAPSYDFGVQTDVVIPRSIEPLKVEFEATGAGSIEATMEPASRGALRIIIQEMTPEGRLRRSTGGPPPDGENMGKVFALSATQGGRTIPVKIDYDKIIWSGLGWAVGEIEARDLTPGIPLQIHFHSSEKDAVKLKGVVYQTSACDGSTVADAYGPEAAAQAKEFLAEFQRVVKADDKAKFATLVHYPLRVLGGKHNVTIASPSELIQEYSSVMTPGVKRAILAQTGECLFGNDQGMMIGSGDVWFREQQGHGMKIITINLGAPGSASGTSGRADHEEFARLDFIERENTRWK